MHIFTYQILLLYAANIIIIMALYVCFCNEDDMCNSCWRHTYLNWCLEK